MIVIVIFSRLSLQFLEALLLRKHAQDRCLPRTTPNPFSSKKGDTPEKIALLYDSFSTHRATKCCITLHFLLNGADSYTKLQQLIVFAF